MKRRSGTRSPQPLERLVFFVDRDLGVHDVPMALREAGVQVELHRDHFSETTPDTEWIAAVTARRWIILTQDRGILRHPHERHAVVSAGARYFCVAGGSRRGVETAAMVKAQLPAIEAAARSSSPPILGRVTQGGVYVFDAKAQRWDRWLRRTSSKRG